MSELQVAAAQQLADFVDLEFARRLEMAETVLPDCVEALRRYNPASPSEAETVGWRRGLLRRQELSLQPDRGHGAVRRSDCR